MPENHHDQMPNLDGTAGCHALAALNADDRTDAEQMLANLASSGYAPRERFNDLAPGVRIRHDGHRWPEAYRDGTGVVVAVLERDPSSWSQSWGAPDIELVVAYDKPTLPEMSRIVGLAQYHVQAVTA